MKFTYTQENISLQSLSMAVNIMFSDNDYSISIPCINKTSTLSITNFHFNNDKHLTE